MVRRVYFRPTAYKHYENFWGHDRGDINVFNYTNNFNCCGGSIFGGGCYGGGSKGGFWGGFGFGIGMGLFGMVSNIFGGFGGLGGFGGFGGFGGLNGLWGGGNPWSNNSKTDDTVTHRSSRATKQVEDKDQAVLSGFNKRLEKLVKANVDVDTNKQDAIKLYNDIVDAKENLKDDIYTDNNKADMQRMLKELKDIYKLTLDNDGKVKVEEPATQTSTTTPTVSTSPESPTVTTPVEAQVSGKITIGNKEVDIDDIKDVDDLKGLSRNDLDKIKPDDAKKILANLQINENSELNGKMVKSYGVLLLLEKSGLKVKIAFNKDTKTGTVKDHWIAGTIFNVEKTDDKNAEIVAFDVDCNGVGVQGNKYLLQQKTDGTANTLSAINTFRCKVIKLAPGVRLDDKKIDETDYNIISDDKPMEKDGRRLTTKT